jgi:hypothetical protein
MFKHLKQCADLGNLDFLGTISESDPTLVKIELILEKAVDVYDKLCVAGLWLKLDKNIQRALTSTVNFCWNCGGLGHSASECPKPLDQETFMRRTRRHTKKPSALVKEDLVVEAAAGAVVAVEAKVVLVEVIWCQQP